MKITFYVDNIIDDHLYRAFETSLSRFNFNLARNVEELSGYLIRSTIHLTPVILKPASRQNFEKLLPLKNILNDKKVIIILPDHEDETIKEAFKYYPRFMEYLDSDYKNVGLILEMMHKNAINYDLDMADRSKLMHEGR